MPNGHTATVTKPASQPAAVSVPAKRGRPKGVPRGAAREPEAIFSEKMLASYGTTTLLLKRLQSLARHKAIRDDVAMRTKYNHFVDVIVSKINACRPAEDVTAQKESLEGFLASSQ